MIVRLFGLMGPRYNLTRKGAKYYLAACALALVAFVYLVTTGLAWIDDAGSVNWFTPTLVILVGFLVTLRLVVLASLNGTPVVRES